MEHVVDYDAQYKEIKEELNNLTAARQRLVEQKVELFDHQAKRARSRS